MIWKITKSIILNRNNPLRSWGEHLTKGSPWYPFLQEHIGACEITRQLALMPQTFDSEQGSTQRLFWHALDRSHSELLTHSGRQEGGEPIIDGRQEQIGWLLGPSLHWEFGPHGDGWHGFLLNDVVAVSVTRKNKLKGIQIYEYKLYFVKAIVLVSLQ